MCDKTAYKYRTKYIETIAATFPPDTDDAGKWLLIKAIADHFTGLCLNWRHLPTHLLYRLSEFCRQEYESGQKPGRTE